MSHDANVFRVDDVERQCSSAAVHSGTVIVRLLAPKEVDHASRANWYATARLSHGRLVQLCSGAAGRHGRLVPFRAAHHAVALLRLALCHLQARLKLHPRTRVSKLFRRAATLAPLVLASALGRLLPCSEQRETPPQNAVRTLVVRLARTRATSKDTFLVRRRAAVFCGARFRVSSEVDARCTV